MKRKIAFISEHASPLATLGGVDAGGQNLYVGQLAKHLARLGYEIDIFTRWDDARLPTVLEWNKGVKLIHIKAGPVSFVPKEELFKHMDEFVRNMAKFINEQEDHYRLIHANFWMSAYAASKIKKLFNIPFVITFHALGKVRGFFQREQDRFPKQRTRVEAQAISDAVFVIAECPQDKKDLIRYYHANADKIEMIPCGFDPAEFYPIDKLLARMVLDFDPDDKIILQLGRIVRRKGIDNVIESLSFLQRRHKIKAKLVIVGGDADVPNARLTPEIGRLRQIARQKKVAENVYFAGRRSREALKYFYNAADVFVTTPWYEPFGITPLEAMACGTPVIGSNVGGIKYSVQDKKSGFLIAPNAPEDLAEKLADIFKNRKIANLFKENSIRRVNSQFTWEKVTGQMSRLYEKVVLEGSHFSETEKQLNIIEKNFEGLKQTINASEIILRISILDAAHSIYSCFTEGGKVFICGNGGSAADSQHFAGELVGSFLLPYRKALPVISLNTDSSVITAISNDIGYSEVFSRQLEALGQQNDILIGISTSGNSQNVNLAFAEAHKKGMRTIGLLGRGGGEAADICDIAIIIPSDDTQRIQELHTHIIHTLSEILERQLFSESMEEKDFQFSDRIRDSFAAIYAQDIKANLKQRK